LVVSLTEESKGGGVCWCFFAYVEPDKGKQIARRGVIASDSSKGQPKKEKNIKEDETRRKDTPPLKSKKNLENRELR
jgi:hypothetical protein